MALEPTDNYIVERDEVLYSIEHRLLKQQMEDTDLLAVGRGDTNYKVAWSEIKDDLAGGGSIPDAYPTPDQVTATPDFQGGDGSEGLPYQLKTVVSTIPGGTVLTDELITIDVGGEGLQVINFEVIQGDEPRWEQQPKVTSNVGVWTGRLTYTDNPETTIERNYNARFKIGDTYFRWTVEQKLFEPVGPEIENVSLVETNPGEAPRFTDQEFVATVSMTEEGDPVSTKVIDAYVEGSITTQVQFDEPLESSGDAIIGGKAWQDDVSYNTSGSTTNTPAKMFDGNIEANSTNAFYFFGAGEIIWDTSNYPLSGSITVHTYGDPNTQYKVVITKGANLEEVEIPFTGTGIFIDLDCGNHSDVREILLYGPENTVLIRGYSIDGEVVISDQDIDLGTALTFAAGTDMSALEAGDVLTQESSDGGITYSDFLSSTSGFGPSFPAINAFDGQSGTYASSVNGNPIVFDCSTFPISGDISVQPYWDNPGTNSVVKAYTDGNTSQYAYLINVTSTDPAIFPSLSNVTMITIERAGTQQFCGLRSISVDGTELLDGAGTTTGVVGSVTDTTVNLSNSSGTWTDGVNVTGPEKTVVEDNVKKYLKFDSDGNVTDLLSTAQDPKYMTTDENPTLTLKFPSTFPSGQAPDDELSDGTTLTVDVYAFNIADSTGHKQATVQPEGVVGPDVTLAGMSTTYIGHNSGTDDIVTGIDLVNNDGLVWIKNRTSALGHQLYDTLRGATNKLDSSTNEVPQTVGSGLMSFNDNGFTVGTNSGVGNAADSYVAWTFEKAAGYFDVIKMTKTNSTDTVQHNLGQKPGMIIGKNLSIGSAWLTYHSGVGNTRYGVLSDPGAWATDNTNTIWVGEPTDTEFKVGTGMATSGEHIFYVFAEDTPGLIKSGSYIGTGNLNFIDTGFDPQWVLLKPWSANGIWTIMDSARGSGTVLQPHVNSIDIKNLQSTVMSLDSGGFTLKNNDGGFNASGIGYMYVAIAKPTTRSLTQEEFAEQRLKFLTYENRKHVECGKQAEADRDALISYMAAQGYDLDDILKYL